MSLKNQYFLGSNIHIGNRVGGSASGGFAGWSHYFDVTVPASQVDADQTSFPIPLQFDVPAGVTLRENMPDLRVCDLSTLADIPYTTPANGLNSTTRKCDLWIKPDSLSSSVDNVFRIYVGNASVDAPESGITWPTTWKRLITRPGIGVDLINDETLTQNLTTLNETGQVQANANSYADYAVSSDVHVGSNDFTMVSVVSKSGFGSNDMLIGGPRASGNNSDTSYILFWYDTSHCKFAVNYGSLGVEMTSPLALGTFIPVIVRRNGNAWDMWANGGQIATMEPDITVNSPTASLRIGNDSYIGTWGFQGTIHATIIVNGGYFTDAQMSIISSSLGTPGTFQSVGSLVAN